VLADRAGVVRHAILGGGASDVANEVGRGTQLVVAETSVGALPIVVRAAGDACVVVASVTFPADRADLGVIATSPSCGLGARGLVSSTTRQPGYVVLADLMPTTLELLDIDHHGPDEAAPIRPAGGPPTVQHLIDVDRRSAVTGNAEGYFVALVAAAALGGLFVVVFADDRWRRRYGAVVLALPVVILLIDVVPWWRSGTAAGMALAIAVATIVGLVADRVLRRAPRLVVGTIAAATATVLAFDASTGGRLQLDSVIANNAIGAGRFAGMGNVPYGFFVAACIVAAGIALDRWGRKAVVPLIVAFAAATVADGAPSLGADVGGVLSAVPAFALLMVGWRRPLALRRLTAVALSGVLVLVAFAAVDVSRPASRRTHHGRTLTNGEAIETFVRREINSLKTFRESPWLAVLLVALVGLYVVRDELPSSRPMRVMLAALGAGALLGTFLNDSGVAVAGSMAAVAWPAYLVLVDAPPQRGGSSRYSRTPSTVPMKR
jgi:MFS family permease